MTSRHYTYAHAHATSGQQEPKHFSWKCNAVEWFRRYSELEKKVTTYYTNHKAGIKKGEKQVKQEQKQQLMKIDLMDFYRRARSELNNDGFGLESDDHGHDDDDGGDDDEQSNATGKSGDSTSSDDVDNDVNDNQGDNDDDQDSVAGEGDDDEQSKAAENGGDISSGDEPQEGENAETMSEDEVMEVGPGPDIDVELLYQGHVVPSDGDKKPQAKTGKNKKGSPKRKKRSTRIARRTGDKKKIGTVELRKKIEAERQKKKTRF